MRRDRAASYATRALERARRRKHRPAPAHLGTGAAGPVEDLFHDSLVLTFPNKEERRWLTVPLAFGLHVVALAAVVLLPILVPLQRERPPVVLAVLNFAPPPPPPPLKGSPLLPTPDRDEVPKPQTPDDKKKTFEIEDKELPIKIPDEILKPKAELQSGTELGLETGDIQGMEGGVPGGVVGGVPGGIVGGVIGGTGTDVPEPNPDVGPQAIRMTRPAYTIEAIRKKLSGEVVLQAVIDVQGRVRVVKIVRSIPELDQQAVQAVERDWLFRPARKNGRPVASLAYLTVTFNLY